MLIHFVATIEQISAENPEEIERLISNLLRASSTGTHLVVVDRMICDWVKAHLSFNNREVAQLDRLKELYTQRGGLPSIARSILEVEVGNAPLAEHQPHKYRIGHEPFLSGNYLEAAKLLVATPTASLPLAVLISVGIYHAALGVQVIIEDYVPLVKGRNGLITFTRVALGGIALVSLVALARITF